MMKKTVLVFWAVLLSWLSAAAQNNIKKTAGVNYTGGPPTYTPSLTTASEYAIDTTNGYFYQWHRTGGTSGTWLRVAQGIDAITGSIPPAYTPVRNMSHFAINDVDSLYRWDGVAWNCLNCPDASGGTVVSFAAGDLPPVFTTNVTDPTTTPTLSFALDDQAANTHFSGPVSGGDAPPTFRALALADILGLYTGNNGVSDNESGGGVFRLGNRYMGTPDAPFTMARKVNIDGFLFHIGDATDSTLWVVDGANDRVGVGTDSPSRKLHVAGEVRVTDLTTDTPTLLVGADGDGDFSSVTVGTGLSLAAGVLSSTVTTYTDEEAQDAVGGILVDGTTIDFTYSDPTPSITAEVINNSISNAKIRQGVARSVIGVTGNATANVADIQGTTDQVLRVNTAGTALAFGTVATGGITNDAVTYAKLQNVAANNVFLGNDNGTNQDAQELTAAEAKAILGIAGTANRFTLWTAANTLGDDGAFTFDAANDRVTFAGTVAGLGANNAFLNLNSGAIAGATEFLRASGNITSNMILGAYNANNAAGGANTIWVQSVGGANAGDPFFQLNINGVVTHAFGVDNSDGDKVKLTMNGATPGANGDDGFTWSNTSPPRYGINIATPLHPLDVSGVARGTMWKNTGNLYTAGNLIFGTGAGTGPVLTSIAGGNNHVEVVFTTGTTPTNNGSVFSINYPNSFGTNTTVVPGAGNDQAATDLNKIKINTSNPNTMEVVAVGTLAASTAYSFQFVIFGY